MECHKKQSHEYSFLSVFIREFPRTELYSDVINTCVFWFNLRDINDTLTNNSSLDLYINQRRIALIIHVY